MALRDKVKASALYRELTPRLFALFMFISIGAINFGIDNGWWAAVITIDDFIETFGRWDPVKQKYTLPSSWLSAGSGTANAGMALGAFAAGPIIKKLGRRLSVVVIVAIALLGMILQISIHSYWGIMAGRTINSFSMGIEINNVPMYMSELSPPAIRGSLVNLFSWWEMIGVLIAKGICHNTMRTYANSAWSWRTVLVFQMIVPVIMLCALWLVPESPRWLIQRNRHEEAEKALAYIRKGVATDEEVHEELVLTQQAVAEQEELHKATSYLDCFKGSNGRRLMIATGVQVLQQLSGNAFMTSYSVIFFAQVGLTDPLGSAMARNAMAIGGSMFAFYLADKVGRRPLLIVSAVGMWIALWVVAGVAGYTTPSGGMAQFLLALMLIWSFFGNLGWGSCVWIVTAEVPTNSLREKTISLASTFSFIAVLLVSYINPYVQGSPGNLDAKVGFIYGSFSLLAIFFVYFCVPECANRSLEELDEMFQNNVPAWKFKGYVCHGIGARLTEVQDHNAAGLKTIEGKAVTITETELENQSEKKA
ncbi:hypothetical protein A1O1_04562 [Capronia coronata CBS 617.96]|uniref:Major facilitator superfamily (MFS) profile domain-containing protein n=1 Tax=Capronia coronata CBS 617.96 TaxID=1182541 RepID=W9YP64_9EURO|nr:uncharacterized protein A1O1_04562 [Capronia coronata CBS 617.96]EXJ91450.1 hypothetical protein A1O1_04562 [Capronia coronata CBS 617.96]